MHVKLSLRSCIRCYQIDARNLIFHFENLNTTLTEIEGRCLKNKNQSYERRTRSDIVTITTNTNRACQIQFALVYTLLLN